MTVSRKILSYYRSLRFPGKLPAGIEIMNPYQDPGTFALCKQFYEKYYDDDNPRTLILGINPGRFGGGATGIPFTDPVKLEARCGIENALPKKTELSSDYIYKVIDAYGGPEKFYSHFLIGSVCPLGFTRGGKNLNYYDDRKLKELALPLIRDSLKEMVTLSGGKQQTAICLGEGTNYKMLMGLNAEGNYFKSIIPLAHPRFILQYRRKKIDEYVESYLKALEEARSSKIK